MAAIFDPDGTLSLSLLAEGTKKALPFYARPIFIRILKKLDMTGMCFIDVSCLNLIIVCY
jgi:solute carrier family 27 fatty acid transporter 1/4